MRQLKKIKDLHELQKLLEPMRSKRKIVLCHGTFDLLHIGHIRHFAEAKRMGDVLVVTVTPDRYVNKGPNRPAFEENFRVEAIGALDCVDYVALNEWPTAVETIQMLRPDFYVKGPDYREADADTTGGIRLEEAAITDAGGEIVFTEDITFSSSGLLNRQLGVLPREASDYLDGFSKTYCVEDVRGYLENARALNVLVVGDTIIDEYQYCDAIGKSSKEPMLAVKRLSTERFAGGVLAVANHVANFCEHTELLTVLGTENSEEAFIRANLHNNVVPTFLFKDESPTVVKRRIVENYFFTKLVEVYDMNDRELNQVEDQRFCDVLMDVVPEYDAVIIMDFGHGTLSKHAIDVLCRKARFLAVNAQANAANLGYNTISRYPRADYVCLAEAEIRLESRDRVGDLESMVLDISRKLSCERIVATLGSKGCLCYSSGEGFFRVPALAGQVVDRMGAGDAFLSLTALCVAQKAPIELVGLLGNAAGAQACATVGHRDSVDRVSLLKHIESLLK